MVIIKANKTCYMFFGDEELTRIHISSLAVAE